MSQGSFSTADRASSAILGRAALLTVVVACGAVAACALADYLTRQRAERVGVGATAGPAAAIEEWLRQTTARLKQGSHELLASVDARSIDRN